jgi:hypothetical protein
MPNNNITNEDLLGLYPVNLNALVDNVMRYGKGNRKSVSEYKKSPSQIIFPRLKGFRFNNSYEEEEPVLVPRLKLGTLKTKKEGAAAATSQSVE